MPKALAGIHARRWFYSLTASLAASSNSRARYARSPQWTAKDLATAALESGGIALVQLQQVVAHIDRSQGDRIPDQKEPSRSATCET